jgi:hypothetical protein
LEGGGEALGKRIHEWVIVATDVFSSDMNRRA